MDQVEIPRVIAGKKNERGQALVEFALTLAFIFLLFIGLLEIIFLMYAYNTLANAAKEGVRYAIVHGTQNVNCSGPLSSTFCTSPDTSPYANVQAVVANFAGLSMQKVPAGNVTVDYNPNSANPTGACNNPGCLVRVTVHQKYQPFFGLGWPSVTLYAVAEGRIFN